MSDFLIRMKRTLQPKDQNYNSKQIAILDKGLDRKQVVGCDKTPYGITKPYVIVPVYAKTEKLTKKQIKDASTMYNISYTNKNSFVLSLKSDPQIRIAVPKYRVNENPSISVSNYYPDATEQATPPPDAQV